MKSAAVLFIVGAVIVFSSVHSEAAPNKKPNIVVIWGDDIGWNNASCYHRGMMGYRTPNIDRIAQQVRCSPIGMVSKVALPARPSLRTEPLPHGLVKGRFARRQGGHLDQRPDHRRVIERAGLCNRTIWQEPSRRPRRDDANQSWL